MLRSMKKIAGNERGQIGEIVVIVVLIIFAIIGVMIYIKPVFNAQAGMTTQATENMNNMTSASEREKYGTEGSYVSGQTVINAINDNANNYRNTSTANQANFSYMTVTWINNSGALQTLGSTNVDTPYNESTYTPANQINVMAQYKISKITTYPNGKIQQIDFVQK